MKNITFLCYILEETTIMEWREIEGWSNYAISIDKQVKSKKTGRILSQDKQWNCVYLEEKKSKKRKTASVNQLHRNTFPECYTSALDNGKVWKNIDGFSNYLICEDEQVANKTTGLTIKPNQYNSVCLISDKGNKENFHRTKLCYETFGIPWNILLKEGEEVKPLITDRIPEGAYYVTSYGRVFSMWTMSFMKPQPSTCGRYQQYSFTADGKTTKYQAHRLVGMFFLEDFKEDLYVCHKDETLHPELLHRADNLFIGTPSDNAQDMVSKGRQRKQNGV